jgi:hypothetical protein
MGQAGYRILDVTDLNRSPIAVRQRYTDQDEVLFDAARPVILNGIEDVITRPDLADRSIFLTLPPGADARRPAGTGHRDYVQS